MTTTIKHTEAEARETISKIVTPVYGRFGYHSEEMLVEYLMNLEMAVHEYDDDQVYTLLTGNANHKSV